MVLCSKCCISEMAAMVCMCDTPLDGLLNSVIGSNFIVRRGAIINIWQVPVVLLSNLS